MSERGGNPRADRWRTAVGYVALALAGLVTVAQAQGGVRTINPDFVMRHSVGRVVADGGSPYDQHAIDAEVDADQRPLPVFFDAPPSAAIFRAVSIAPVRVASTLWTILSLAAAALIAAFVVRRDALRLLLLAVPCILVFTPVRIALGLGQPDLVYFGALVAAAWWQERSTRPWLAAAAVPLMVLKPQTGALVAAVIGVRALVASPRRAMLAAATGGLGLLALGAALASGANWADWIERVGERGRGAPGVAFLTIAVTLGAVIAAVRSWRRARASSVPVDWLVVAGAANGLLAVTGAWNSYWFLALALPLGALLVDARAGRITLSPPQQQLLVAAAGLMAGNASHAYVWHDGFRTAVPPLAGLTALLAGLVLLRELTWRPAVGVLAVNAMVTALALSPNRIMVVSVLASAILLYLVVATGAGAATPSTVDPVRPVGAR